MSIQTIDSLKNKAAIIRAFLKEKYDIDVSQGHSLELISKVSGFKDWNTASAALRPKLKQDTSSVEIETVGDLKKALEPLDDSAMIEADYKFKRKELKVAPNDNPEDELHQEFSFAVEELAKDMVSIKLTLVYESVFTKHDNGFYELQTSDEF